LVQKVNMTKPKTIRKISYLGISGRYYSDHVYHSYPDRIYPCLILQGRWLEKRYDIRIGDYVEIIYGDNVIQIKKLKRKR